ncbi:MAG: prepilin-type N-terminal cleavage/methylation domain-containing protein, partial [Candidatus Pacebacteria bacterium]|nr:prepilin-type N-terminal cleavage/methylation domain-containing protein [Candidatus Paceibacterota bacterium]
PFVQGIHQSFDKEKMDKSFTLIEILVVIVIIGIFSAFIIVSMSGVSQKATIAKGQAFSNSLKNSLMLNLVSEYKFEGPTAVDGTATINDAKDTWGSNNATAIDGNPTVKGGADCVSGKCVDFDSDWITLNQNLFPSGLGSWTVEGWFYHKDYTYPRAFCPIGDVNSYLAGNKGWQIGAGYSSGGIRVSINDGVNLLGGFITLEVGSRPPDMINKWCHMVIVFDRTSTETIIAYINAKKQSATIDISALSGDIQGNTDIKIGNAVGWLLYGRADEVRMYNEIVPVAKIEQNYYSGLNKLLANKNIEEQEYSQRINQFASN